MNFAKEKENWLGKGILEAKQDLMKIICRTFLLSSYSELLGEVMEDMWQVREDWRNDGQIQALPTADYLISIINSKLLKEDKNI